MSHLYEAIAPANIAFIKYWGKQDPAEQWPANDSLSMSLSKCNTRTSAIVIDAGEHEVSFSGKRLTRESAFGRKAFAHLDNMARALSFETKLEIKTSNSFPSECGIASSASGLSALTIAAVAAWSESRTFDDLCQNGFTRTRLAAIARRGSGSACRSLWGGYVQWQANSSPQTQSASMVHDSDYWSLSDMILLVDPTTKKKTSSSAHLDAWSSILYAPRLAGLKERHNLLRKALEERRLDLLGPIIEAEALEMHAVMMTAKPPTDFISKNTSELLAWIRKKRQESSFPAYFTIDAGPNIHLIYESAHRTQIIASIQSDFPELKFLDDQVGKGPSLVTRDATSARE